MEAKYRTTSEWYSQVFDPDSLTPEVIPFLINEDCYTFMHLFHKYFLITYSWCQHQGMGMQQRAIKISATTELMFLVKGNRQ